MDDKDTIATTDDTNPAQTDPVPVVPPNADELNKQLLEAQAKLKTLQDTIRNNEFEKVLRAHNVKPEFDDYVKYKLNWTEITDFNNAVTDFIVNNPSIVTNITTGGVETTVDTNPAPTEKVNPLLDYKEKNNL